jgi:enoyl-[acyl-carrier protein] reductase I
MQDAGGGIVSLDFDASVAWPIYDWMGVSKAALEAVTRYLARDLGRFGIRVNCVSAGPLRTMAAKGIPGFQDLADVWGARAPLPWDVTDPSPVAKAAVFLLSDWASGITGEIVHVDGGYHAMGADIAPASASED